MARPTKQGIDYFPLDVNFDEKTELYLLEHEADGLAVMIVLFQLIYSNEGYYINNNDDLLLLVKKRINVNINKINDCINSLIERNILDKNIHKKHNVLTSNGIQKRFFDAAKRKKEVKIIKEYVITDINEYENLINVSNNATKEKEKEKEDVKHKYGEYKHVLLTDKQYQKLKKDYDGQLDIMIQKLDEGIQQHGYSYKDHNLTLRKWFPISEFKDEVVL